MLLMEFEGSLSLIRASFIISTLLFLIYLISILVLPSHLLLCLASGLFPSVFSFLVIYFMNDNRWTALKKAVVEKLPVLNK